MEQVTQPVEGRDDGQETAARHGGREVFKNALADAGLVDDYENSEETA